MLTVNWDVNWDVNYVTGCAIAQPRGCILTTLTCEAAERSGARSSWLSMLSTRKVIVKESTHHSAQRSMQLGLGIDGGWGNGVLGNG